MNGRAERINEIVLADRQAFENAIAIPEYKPSLAFPQDACRYLLIPKRLLEIVDNPDTIGVRSYSPNGIGLWGDVYQHPITDRRILYVHLVSQTRNEISPLLFVEDYTDSDGYRHKGVASSFYERLKECATKMGYRFIYGFNTHERIRGFFTEKVGRIPLDHTKPEIWELFSGVISQSSWHHDFEVMTIDFLREEDKDKFVDPNPEGSRQKWREYLLKKDL